MPDAERPFDGLVVLELGQIYNGPYAGLLMAHAGAEVIKVEPPAGDLLRRRGERVSGALYPFVALNSNKHGITLNLKTDRGRELLIALAGRADVLIENFRPGVMERLGVGFEVLREEAPRLIYATSSGFGRSGPYRDYPAMDITVQAISGAMSITGWPDRPPVKAGPAIADFLAGVHLYAAIATALYRRERTGQGALVEATMHEAMFPPLMSSLGLYFGSQGQIPLRTGNRHNGLAEAPYNVYPTEDGELALICVSDAHWANLLRAMDRDDLTDDPRFATMAARVEHIDAVDHLITDYTRTFSTSRLFEHLRSSGVPCAPVKDLAEVVRDPHLRERGLLEDIDHPEMGHVTVFRSPLRVVEGDDSIEVRASPELGRDTERVLHRFLGLGAEDLEELRAAEVI